MLCVMTIKTTIHSGWKAPLVALKTHQYKRKDCWEAKLKQPPLQWWTRPRQWHGWILQVSSSLYKLQNSSNSLFSKIYRTVSISYWDNLQAKCHSHSRNLSLCRRNLEFIFDYFGSKLEMLVNISSYLKRRC